MQTLQLRLHEERKARLIRMKAWQGSPVVPLPKSDVPIPPPEVVSPKRDWLWVPSTPPEPLKLDYIMREVCRYFGLTISDIRSDRRFANLVKARHVYAYVARNHTTKTWGEIGNHIGRDHTTMVHAVQKMELTAATDYDVNQILRAIVPPLTPSEN